MVSAVFQGEDVENSEGLCRYNEEANIIDGRCSEESVRYRRLLEVCPDGIFINRDKAIIYANPAMLQLVGAHRIDELIGYSLPILVEPEYRASLESWIPRPHSIDAALPRLEQKWRRFDGVIIDVEITAAFVPWQGEQAVQAIVRDVTEQRRLYQALEKSKERLRLTQSHGKIGIWSWDPTSDAIEVEPEFEELYGVLPGTIRTYQDWANRINPDDLTRGRSESEEALAERRSFEIEFRITHVDGEVKWLLSRGRGEYDASGRLIGVLGVHIDVTEQKRIQEALRESEERFRRSQSAARSGTWEWDLASDAVDWSSGIYDLLGLPRDSVDPSLDEWLKFIIPEDVDSTQKAIQEIIERPGEFQVEFRVRRSDGAIRWLAAIGRVEEGTNGTPCRLLGVNIDITERKAVEEALRERITREHAFSEHLPVGVWFIAAKYTLHAGRISLAAEKEEKSVVFRVSDTGQGISEELLPYVFDLFVQDKRSLDRSQGGLGIGLAMAKGLVELHGGTVKVESTGTGKGSVFCVRLPLTQHAPASSVVGEPRVQALEQGIKVLVVDDNIDAAETLAELIQLWGHKVEVVYRGEDALEAVTYFHPHVILLDIGLPGLNGYEVGSRLRTLNMGGTLKLIAVTGYGQEGDRERAQRAGFDYHLTKPVDLTKLRELLAPNVHSSL